MNLIIPGWESVLQMLIPMCTVICIAGAILLLLHAEGSRSKRLLAYVMLAWGIAYAIRIFGLLFGFMGTLESSVLAPFVLITGNLYAIITLFYPLEVVRPGWLTPKRCLLVMSPYLVIVAFYLRLCICWAKLLSVWLIGILFLLIWGNSMSGTDWLSFFRICLYCLSDSDCLSPRGFIPAMV